MALKKPTDFFNDKRTSGFLQSPEVSSNISEHYDKFLKSITTVDEVVKKSQKFENVIEEITDEVKTLSEEISSKVDRSDLEAVLLSHLMTLEENFNSIKDQVKSINKKDLKEFKSISKYLIETVNSVVTSDIPSLKNKLTKNEFFFKEEVYKLIQENEKFRDNLESKLIEAAEVIDTNINYFNKKLEDSLNTVNKTVEDFNKINSVIKNKLTENDQKLDQYNSIFQEHQSSLNQISENIKQDFSNVVSETKNKFKEYKQEFKKFSNSVKITLEEYQKEINDVKADVAINEQHLKNINKTLNEQNKEIFDVKTITHSNEESIKTIDEYINNNYKEITILKEKVFNEINNLPFGNIQENINRLEKKIDFIKETYSQIKPDVIVEQVIKEGLLNEPPTTKNSDPLTPLNKNFVTLDQLQQHYRLFLNRIQQQISTLGGGGETRLRYLDDIVGIATNPSAYDGKYLKYNHSLRKFEFVEVTAGSANSWADSAYGTYSNSNIGIGTSAPLSKIHVIGDGRFTGVVTATTFIGNLTGTAATATNISGGTIGAIVYQSGINSTTFLSPGTPGQVLTTAGIGSTPYWSTVSGGGGASNNAASNLYLAANFI